MMFRIQNVKFLLNAVVVFALAGAPFLHGTAVAEEDEEAIAAKEQALRDKKKKEQEEKAKAEKDAAAAAAEKVAAEKAEKERLRKLGIVSISLNPKIELPVVCQECLGKEIVPILPPPVGGHYIKIVGEKSPPDDKCITWKHCPKCQKGADPKVLVTDMLDRQAKAEALGKEWADALKTKFSIAITPHMAIYVQGANAQAKNFATMVEKCCAHFEMNTKTMVMTATRPDTDVVVFINDSKIFDAFIDEHGKHFVGREDFKKHGYLHNHHASPKFFAFRVPDRGTVDEKFADAFGNMLVGAATDQKPADWLKMGMDNYVDWTVFGTNNNFRAYKNGGKASADVHNEIKTRGGSNRLKAWDEMVKHPLGSMNADDAVSAFGMTAFLTRMDGKNLAKIVLAMNKGATSTNAIEGVFGKSLREVGAMCNLWCTTVKPGGK